MGVYGLMGLMGDGVDGLMGLMVVMGRRLAPPSQIEAQSGGAVSCQLVWQDVQGRIQVRAVLLMRPCQGSCKLLFDVLCGAGALVCSGHLAYRSLAFHCSLAVGAPGCGFLACSALLAGSSLAG